MISCTRAWAGKWKYLSFAVIITAATCPCTYFLQLCLSFAILDLASYSPFQQNICRLGLLDRLDWYPKSTKPRSRSLQEGLWQHYVVSRTGTRRLAMGSQSDLRSQQAAPVQLMRSHRYLDDDRPSNGPYEIRSPQKTSCFFEMDKFSPACSYDMTIGGMTWSIPIERIPNRWLRTHCERLE